MIVDYYFSLNSPWTFLGHDLFVEAAKKAGVSINPFPVDFRGEIFPNTGGLPVNQRPPSRQAYRLQELERWREYRQISLNINPAHWPTDEVAAETLLIAIRESGYVDATLRLAGAFMRAVWQRDLDIASEDTLALLSEEEDVSASFLDAINRSDLIELRRAQSRDAIERGVFGAPSYLIEDDIYWGQDRLDFVLRRFQNQ